MMRDQALLVSLLFCVTCLFSLSACDSAKVFERNINIHNNQWHQLEIVEFEVAISDTSHFYNFFINVRNNVDYAYSNLYVFMNTILPSSTLVRDTIEIMLAEPGGKWLGSGWGNHREIYMPIGIGMKFPEAGTYKFELEQGMRQEILENITHIGIRIEKSN